jgi:DNA-binding CsgD family transcriptional regulator
VPDIDQLMRQGAISQEAYARFGGRPSALDSTGYAADAPTSWADRATQGGQDAADAYQSGQGLRGMLQASPDDLASGFGGAGATKLGPKWWASLMDNGVSRLDHLRAGVEAGKSYVQIAKEIGASQQSTNEMGNSLGLQSTARGGVPQQAFTDVQNAVIRQGAAGGASTRQLAAQLGTSQAAIARQLDRLGLRSGAPGAPYSVTTRPAAQSGGAPAGPAPVTLPRLKFMERPMSDD